MKNKSEFMYPLGELKLRRSASAFAAGEIAFGRPADLDARVKQAPSSNGRSASKNSKQQ